MLNIGEHVSVTYRTGQNEHGNFILETLEHCEVVECDGSILKVRTLQHIKGTDGGEIGTREYSFDVNSPEFVGATPE